MFNVKPPSDCVVVPIISSLVVVKCNLVFIIVLASWLSTFVIVSRVLLEIVIGTGMNSLLSFNLFEDILALIGSPFDVVVLVMEKESVPIFSVGFLSVSVLEIDDVTGVVGAVNARAKHVISSRIIFC